MSREVMDNAYGKEGVIQALLPDFSGIAQNHIRGEAVMRSYYRMARTLTLVAALLLGVSGAYMLILPSGWYASVPGVIDTGPFNGHFVIDVALAYLVSAVGLLVAAVRIDRKLGVLAASWPVLHAAFHLLLWLHEGLPQGPALPTEAVGVLGLGLLAAVGVGLLPKSDRPRGLQ